MTRIRMRTYGLPRTVARLTSSAWAPDEWLPPLIPSPAHGFPARREPIARPFTTIGPVIVLGLARSHLQD